MRKEPSLDSLNVLEIYSPFNLVREMWTERGQERYIIDTLATNTGLLVLEGLLGLVALDVGYSVCTKFLELYS